MWLLSTNRAELHYLVSPEVVEEGYAILSHVWGSDEQSYQDLQELRKRCSTTGENPRALACEKVRRTCELAERHGFKWVWIDTCCIDKTSSAELSEAINSMFRYYSLAHVCYAYLKDVPTEGAFAGHPEAPPFHRSRWHTRGWTLQELVAPRTVIFLSCDWVALGSKVDLAASLEVSTGIPAELLRLERNIADFSVAQRMAWAAKRNTTRMEDEAYSLLGIFDIMMPTLYGEGRRAFRRLQEEIMRQSSDPTLFAWGYGIEPSLLGKTSRNWQALREPQSYDRESHLFALRPRAFLGCGRFTYTSHFEDAYVDHGGDPEASQSPSSLISRPVMDDTMTFAVTPSGVLAHIPLMDLHTESGLTFADLGLCAEGHRLLLVLLRRPHTPPKSHPAYHIGARNLVDQDIRLIKFESQKSIDWDDWPITSTREAPWEWKDVYLLHNVPSLTHMALPDVPLIPVNHSLLPPFRFPDVNIRAFVDSLRSGSRFFKRVRLSVRNVQVPTSEALPVSFVFAKGHKANVQTSAKFAIVISVGQCTAPNWITPPTSNDTQPSAHESTPLLWAHVQCYADDEDLAIHTTHDCGHDHVSAWSDLKKTFTCGENGRRWDSLQITLSFTPCPFSPDRTLILNASASMELVQPKLSRVDGDLHQYGSDNGL